MKILRTQDGRRIPLMPVRRTAAYDALAAYYDAFTDDVPYKRWADWAEAAFARAGIHPEIVLDLACGTGTLTALLRDRGYDMIGSDASEAMLARAVRKAPDILWLHQRAEELDLYGTIDACTCSLDAVNYLTQEDALARAFRRVALFLVPGGVFLFDALTPAEEALVDDASFIRECPDATCIQSESVCGGLIEHRVTLFIRERDGRYARVTELHHERTYRPEYLRELLRRSGFSRVEIVSPGSFDPLADSSPRAAFIAYR